MSLLSARNLSLHFGGLLLLKDANLHVEEKDRICLLGRNGAGKTTLLRVLSGELSPDSGVIDYRQGTRLGILPQEIPDALEGTAFEIALSGAPTGTDAADLAAATQTVETVLSRLFVEKKARFAEMSGGMKRRVLLARALAADPDILFLDEPTNHLDIASIEWLEAFLVRQGRALLYVSHDRAFADAVSTRIVELDRGILAPFAGGYSDYMRQKEAMLDVEARAQDKFEKKLAAEESWIRQGIKARRTRNEGRVRDLEKLREEKRARLSSAGSVKFSVAAGNAPAKRMIAVEKVSFSYPGTPIVEDLSTIVQRGDKVGIIGKNGVGKTTLLRLLLGEIIPSTGEIKRAECTVAYLDQLRGALNDEATLIENLVDQGDTVEVGGKSRHIIGYLQDFLFSGDAARSPAKMLSGGERNRLLLAKLFTQKADVLVLDEPTNDLDIDTLELLESLLVAFEGTVLLVSHDRVFLNNVATSTLVFEDNGKVTEYAGGYDDWLIQRTAAIINQPKAEKKKDKKTKPNDGLKKLSFKEKQELAALPAEIEQLEAERDELHTKTSDPGFYQQDAEIIKTALARMEALEPILEERYARWSLLESIGNAAERV